MADLPLPPGCLSSSPLPPLPPQRTPPPPPRTQPAGDCDRTVARAVRRLRNSGVSPVSSCADYGRPKIGLTLIGKYCHSGGFRPPADAVAVAGAPPAAASPWWACIPPPSPMRAASPSATPAVAAASTPPPPAAAVSPPSDDEESDSDTPPPSPSPSVARSPKAAAAATRGRSRSSSSTPNAADADDDRPQPPDAPAEGLRRVGWTPHRVIRLVTNDELVLCTTPSYDRACLYYPEEIAAPLRAARTFFPRVKTEKASVVPLIESAELDLHGVDALHDAAIHCVEAYDAQPSAVVIGAIAHSVSILDAIEADVQRYYAILQGPNNAVHVVLHCGGSGGDAHVPAKFARAVCVSPVLQGARIMNAKDGDERAAAAEMASYIRARAAKAIRTQLSEAAASAKQVIASTSAEIVKSITALEATLSHYVALSNKRTGALLAIAGASTTTDTSAKATLQQGVLSMAEVTSQFERLIGTASSVSAAAINDARVAWQAAAATAFVEAKVAFGATRKASEFGVSASKEDDAVLARVDFGEVRNGRVPSSMQDGKCSASDSLGIVREAAEQVAGRVTDSGYP